jgi:hypothetical protein
LEDTVSPQRNPVLEIPESFDPDEMNWVHAVVQFDSPKELPPKKEGWKESYMYGLKSNNVDHVLFASPTMHKKIQETGAIKETVIKLGRMGQQTETRWFAKYVSGPKRATNGQEDPTPPQQPTRPAQPVPPPSQNSQPPAPTPVPARQFFYVPMSNHDLFEAMLTDIEKVYWLAYDGVEVSHPKEWNDLEPKDRIERIGATATGFVITLGNHLRSMAGGWNEPSHYAAFNGWGVSNEEGQEQSFDDTDLVFNPDDPRWSDVKQVRSYETDGERKISLARAIAMHDEKIKAYQHAGAILSRFGYDNAGVDSEVDWHMANMVWMYEQLRSEGAAQNDALRLTAETYGHPLDLLNWFDEDDARQETMAKSTAEKVQEQVPVDQEDGPSYPEDGDDDDDMTF